MPLWTILQSAMDFLGFQARDKIQRFMTTASLVMFTPSAFLRQYITHGYARMQ